MNIDHLIKMANEIGSFFIGESAPGQAPRDVASHLRRFWEPRMRREIIAHLSRGGAGLTDVARDAVAMLAAESTRAAAAPPAAPGSAEAAPGSPDPQAPKGS
jgi:formate dehydrogenase subunit delta